MSRDNMGFILESLRGGINNSVLGRSLDKLFTKNSLKVFSGKWFVNNKTGEFGGRDFAAKFNVEVTLSPGAFEVRRRESELGGTGYSGWRVYLDTSKVSFRVIEVLGPFSTEIVLGYDPKELYNIENYRQVPKKGSKKKEFIYIVEDKERLEQGKGSFILLYGASKEITKMRLMGGDKIPFKEYSYRGIIDALDSYPSEVLKRFLRIVPLSVEYVG